MLYYKMNMIMLLILALVLCAYFWPDCPKMLKDNKQMLLGVVVGLVLCTFFKKALVEGYYWNDVMGCHQRERSIAGDTGSRRRAADDRPCNEVGLADDNRCFDSEVECQANRYEMRINRSTPPSETPDPLVKKSKK